MCNLRRPFDAQSYQGLAVKIMKGSYPTITPTYSKQLRDLIISMLSMKPQNRPTIVDILNKPFIRPRLEKYMIDMLTRKHDQCDMDDIYLDTLREQAELLNVSLVRDDEEGMLKPNSSFKELDQKRWTKNIFTKRNEDEEDIKREIYERRRSTFDKESNSLEKNFKRKDDNGTSSSSKALNIPYELMMS